MERSSILKRDIHGHGLAGSFLRKRFHILRVVWNDMHYFDAWPLQGLHSFNGLPRRRVLAFQIPLHSASALKSDEHSMADGLRCRVFASLTVGQVGRFNCRSIPLFARYSRRLTDFVERAERRLIPHASRTIAAVQFEIGYRLCLDGRLSLVRLLLSRCLRKRNQYQQSCDARRAHFET